MNGDDRAKRKCWQKTKEYKINTTTKLSASVKIGGHPMLYHSPRVYKKIP